MTATRCTRTKLEQFRTEKGGWKRVRKENNASTSAKRVVRCNFCGYFHVINWRA